MNLYLFLPILNMSKILLNNWVYVEWNADWQMYVVTETDVATNPNNVGAYRSFWENDSGAITWNTLLRSWEIDVDYRQRTSQDLIFDDEVFNYTAQNTGKHNYGATTMANSWTAGQMTTNSGSITTTTTGTQLVSYAMFPVIATTTLSADTEVGFSAQPQANTFIEFGNWLPGTTTTAPTDGVFFRLSSGWLQGIASFNGSETSTGIFPLSGGTGTWTYAISKRYQFICYTTAIEAVFWVNDGTGAVAMGTIPLPSGQSRMMMSAAAPYFFKHRITGGAAGWVIQATLGAYNIRLWGTNLTTTPSISGSRIMGSYQGLSGGTMGSLAKYTNNTNATAAVPTNTTAALGTGLGGEFWETDTLAANTDGIIMSYQIPAGTVNIPGKRLVLRGLYIDTFVQTALTGGGYNEVWNLNFWHTNVSLATTETATSKARRVVPIGSRTVASGAVALTQLPRISLDMGDNPVFVNPSEFISISKKKVGTAPTAWVMAHNITLIYGWE